MEERKAAGFEAREVLPGIWHIRDALGVCITLIIGEKRALLFDTGYGLFDLKGFVRSITGLPLTVLLSHGHHDHAGGAAQFDRVFLSPREKEVLIQYTGSEQRGRVLHQARAKGLLPPGYEQSAYLSMGPGRVRAFRGHSIALGKRTIRVLETPGHTPGSLMLYIPSLRLLLPGDNWNPTTWVFFPECAPIARYIQTMRGLLPLPFERVLSPHEFALLPGSRLRAFILGLTMEALLTAQPIKIAPYEAVRTYACHPEPGTTFVFDRDKL